MTDHRDDLARALDRVFASTRRLVGDGQLSMTAYGVLAQLEKHQPCQVTQLAELQGASQPAMTGLIQRLTARGLVNVKHDPADRRRLQITLTRTGRKELTTRRNARSAMLRKQLKRLTPQELKALEAALPALVRLGDNEEA